MGNAGKAEYFAFISHKSADRTFALKMQKFIENYRLPAAIQRAGDYPERLSPICCYENDFSSNPLMTEMEDKLSRSEFLILICSIDKEPGGSKYVNFEIETFIKQKKAQGIDPLDRIIPIIVSGAFGSETEECCPAALKALGKNRPIAADRQKYKSDREVFLHAISGMLDIDYAVMVDRDAKRQKKRAWISFIAQMTVGLLICIGLYCFLPIPEHYADFVMKNGLPVGIERLQYNEYQKMNAHYVITTVRGRITKLEYVNSKGSLMKHNLHYQSDRPAKYAFAYKDGALSSVTYYDEYQQPYFVMHYYNQNLSGVDLRESNGGNGVYYISPGYNSNPEKLLSGTGYTPNTLNKERDAYYGMISRLSYTYNENGFVTKVLFHADSSNKRVSDGGVFGFEYELDELGRIRKVYYLDIAQNRQTNQDGIYCTEYIYENNNLTGLKFYGKNGKLKANADGIVQLQWTYDNIHNRSKLEVLDADGAPAMDKSKFYAATVAYVTDKNGNIKYRLSVDENNKYSCKYGDYIQYQYDKNGRLIKQEVLDSDGKVHMYPEMGFAAAIYERDDSGCVTTLRYTDENGQAVNLAEGYSYIQYTFNEQGDVSKIAYFDADGNPAINTKYGYCTQTREYDELGRMTEFCYWGVNQEPVDSTGPSDNYSYHKCSIVYEELYDGFVQTIQSQYDKDGNLAICKDDNLEEGGYGFAQAKIISQNGYITFYASYDVDGQQIDVRKEASRIHNSQAELEETISWIYADDSLGMQVKSVYDSSGKLKKHLSEHYDDGHLSSTIEEFYENEILHKDISIFYDENGNISAEYTTLYNEDGEKISYVANHYNDTEISKLEETTTYKGSKKDIVTTEIWDANGQPFSKKVCSYDSQEREYAAVTQFYKDGVKSDQMTEAYHYEEDGSYKRESIIYDADGVEIRRTVNSYNSNGELIS